MITLFNTNFGRSGSTSLWIFLNQHPQIISSEIKEPVKNQGWDEYYNFWDVDFKDGNVYFEGSPRLFVKPEFNFISERKDIYFDRFCAICVLRNHINYIVSRMALEDSVRPLKDIKYDLFHQDLDRLEKIIGIDNMFIIKLCDIEERQKEIYDFLNIDTNYFFKFPWINSFLNGTNVRKYIHYRKIVLKYFDKIEKYIEEDKEILQEKYGIGDLK